MEDKKLIIFHNLFNQNLNNMTCLIANGASLKIVNFKNAKLFNIKYNTYENLHLKMQNNFIMDLS